jgi:hypothetical protein
METYHTAQYYALGTLVKKLAHSLVKVGRKVLTQTEISRS